MLFYHRNFRRIEIVIFILSQTFIVVLRPLFVIPIPHGYMFRGRPQALSQRVLDIHIDTDVFMKYVHVNSPFADIPGVTDKHGSTANAAYNMSRENKYYESHCSQLQDSKPPEYRLTLSITFASKIVPSCRSRRFISTHWSQILRLVTGHKCHGLRAHLFALLIRKRSN